MDHNWRRCSIMSALRLWQTKSVFKVCVCLSGRTDSKLITAHIWLPWISGLKGPASVDHYLQGVKPQSIVALRLHYRSASSDEVLRYDVISKEKGDWFRLLQLLFAAL